MGVDYYKILGVDRNTNNDDLRRAYRKLALRWHPDKNPDNQRNAEARFKQISEAYDVLCDPRKRAAYDRFGEDSLRGQMPPPGAGGTTYFQTGEGPSTFRFNTRNPADIFAEVFGHSSSFSSGRMGGGGGRGGRRGARSSRSSFGDNTFSSSTHQHAPMKDPTIETKMACSLEDIYKGITKKMKVSRDIIDVTGKTTHEEEILEIQITPGLKEGKKFVFHGKGNVRPNAIPADLAFILDEKPHSVFTRDGNDLVVTKTVTLTKALAGCTVSLLTLDGRNLYVPINSVIHPNYVEVVPGEGMPLLNNLTKKGNLKIKFNIKYPSKLTTEQKLGIKKLLGTYY